MGETRTALQIEANNFDLELFRLSGRAERNMKLCKKETETKDWDAVSIKLFQLRARVRPMMHVRDQEVTE